MSRKTTLRVLPAERRAARCARDETAAVARIKRSEIRGQLSSSQTFPGFHFVQSGLHSLIHFFAGA
jgi:hypothetical protein